MRPGIIMWSILLAALLAACGPSETVEPEDLEVVVEAQPAQGLAPLAVQLSVTVTGGTGVYFYAWDFGDGEQSAEETPSHQFEAAGEFTVRVTVTDTAGGTGEGEATVSVGDDHTPVATASATPSQGIAPLIVSFTGSALGGDEPLTYTWAFGDGAEGVEGRNPTHTYEQEGTFHAVLVVTDADGDSSQDEVEILVVGNDVPLVEVQAEPTSGIAPLTVGFTAAVMGGDEPLTFAWSFGDGETSAVQGPSHLFEAAGSYDVSVTVTDANGDEASDSIVVEVGDDQTPTVVAGATPSSGLAPLPVTFTATVSGGNEPIAYVWDFGDGSPTSDLQNPSHAYTMAGAFTATVTVTDGDGDVASDTVTVEVGSDDLPSATASASPVTGIEPLTVSFTGTGIGGNAPLAYTWSFGDGSPADTAQNPAHVYESAGTYTATLIVTDDDGDSDSDTVTIEVASNAVPVVEASATPASGIEPLAVSFSASVSGGDLPLSYVWAFGDGAPASTSASPSHTYTEGTYTATVSVTDSNGDSTSDSVQIVVGGDDVPSVSALAVPDAGLAPLPVSFSSTVVGGNAPFTYAWNFGDGGTSTEARPSHTFTVASSYSVVVTVRDVDGDVATDTVVVGVSDDSLPLANASASPTFGVAPLTVSFFGLASGGDAPITYEWSFGDGAPSSTAQNPTHEFIAGGTYTAILVVRDADGDSSSDAVTIEVSDDGTPVTYVSATPTSGLTPLTVTLTCGASGGNEPLYYQWTFGDGSAPDESPVTSHRYEAPGLYEATCTVTDTDGDSDSDTVAIHVGDTETPAVDGSAVPAAGRVPLDVAFTAAVVGGTPPFAYLWSFGDGATSTLQNPSHRYESFGVFPAVVQVTDFDGDVATDTVEIRVLETASDLAVTALDVTNVGTAVTYTVTVRNNGPDPIQNFYLDLFYDHAGPPVVGAFGDAFRFITDTLDAGESVTEVFTHDALPGLYDAWAVVDTGGSVPDVNRANNVFGPVAYEAFVLVINEVFYDAVGTDTGTGFVEIYSVPGEDLAGYRILGVNGSGATVYETITLPAGTLVPADGYLVVGASAGVANVDVVDAHDFQNGPDSVQLLDPAGVVVDAVAYGVFGAADTPAGEGAPCDDPEAGYSIGRGFGRPDTNDNATDFLVYRPTPGEQNGFENDACGAEFDLTLNAINYGSTTGYAHDFVASCPTTDHAAPDAVFTFTLAAEATVHLDTNGSAFDTVLSIRTACADQTTELECDDDDGDGLQSLIERVLPAGTYYVIVDGYSATSAGSFVLNYRTL